MKLKHKLLTAVTAIMALMATAVPALAADGDSLIVDAVTQAVSTVSTDAVVVIGAAVGLGAIFWGAKVLWGKFKGMAK